MIEQAPTRMTKTKNVNTSESPVQRGSGNVFADLDLPDADLHLLKAKLVSRLDDIVRQRSMTQAELARTLGLSRSDVPRLQRGEFREYSLDRLFRCLMALGCDIEIIIRKSHTAIGGKLRMTPSEIG